MARPRTLAPRPLRLALLACLVAGSPAIAAETHLTVYRDNGDALFADRAEGHVESGYAMVDETRQLQLQAGRQQTQLADLPPLLDPQSLSITAGNGHWRLRSRRLLPPAGDAAQALLNQSVDVIGEQGQLLGHGRLRSSTAGLVLEQSDGQQLWLQHYAALRSQAPISTGARVQLELDSPSAGAGRLDLSYLTRGLGWRAVYQADLSGGDDCHLQLSSQASIANRSGRDWQGVQIDLIAGQLNLDGGAQVRPLMLRALSMAKAEDTLMPAESALDAYRSYRLPAGINLPDQSITDIPLYPTQAQRCQRLTEVDLGSSPSGGDQPALGVYPLPAELAVQTQLRFQAAHNLPAGMIYVNSAEPQAPRQLLGVGRVNDTPRGQSVQLTLGQSFMLSAHQQRVSSQLDRQNGHFDERFKVVLTNAGDQASEVTVISHPRRWSQWSVPQASEPASKDSDSQLHFVLKVPAHGQRALDFTLRYQWQPGDLPAQPR